MMATGHGQWLGAGLIGRFDFRKGRNAHQRRRLPLFLSTKKAAPEYRPLFLSFSPFTPLPSKFM